MPCADAARHQDAPAPLGEVGGATAIVMYHYIRPRDTEHWPGLFPLEPSEFEQQLDALAQLGEIIRPDAIDEPCRTRRPRFVLTFDDGTRDHFETATPILARRGLSGLFGVISGPASGKPMPNPHLIHWLTSKRDDATIWSRLVARFGEAALGEPPRATALYHRDTPLRARIKFALNFALGYDAAQSCLVEQVRELNVDAYALAREWFLAADEVCAMHAAGMMFAVHADQHRPYAGPPDRFYRAELEPCERWLAGLLGERPRHYIAAFGGSNAGGDRLDAVASTLAARGYAHGYLTRPGITCSPGSQFFLPRIDAADLPPRKSVQQLELLLTRSASPT